MATKTKKLTLGELAAQYGYAAAFFFSDAELKRLIEKAVKEQWTPQKFQASFMATRWYRARAADTRAWLELKARDPKEAATRKFQRQNQIQVQAAQMGISLSRERSAKLAEDSLMLGWSDSLIQQAIGAEFRYKPGGGTQGQAATVEDFIRRTAGDYGVTVSSASVGKWVQDSLKGVFTEDNIRDLVRDMARSKYPGMAAELEKGWTVRDVAENYVQSYSQILETPADQVKLEDTRIQKALQGVRDPKTGQATMQSVYDFERDLRKDPRWRRTKNAHEQMTNAALGVLQDMGIYS